MLENAVWHVQPEWDRHSAVQLHVEAMSMILGAAMIASEVVFPLWNMHVQAKMHWKRQCACCCDRCALVGWTDGRYCSSHAKRECLGERCSKLLHRHRC